MIADAETDALNLALAWMGDLEVDEMEVDAVDRACSEALLQLEIGKEERAPRRYE